MFGVLYLEEHDMVTFIFHANDSLKVYWHAGRLLPIWPVRIR